jgi:CRP-like cAMP-binding protein
MDQQIFDYYAQHDLQRFVGAEQIGRFTMRHFAPGENICELEQPIDGLYFFVAGRARVFLPMANSRQLLLCFYQPLQVFGDVELFEPEPLATTTIEALTPCVCLGLSREFVLTQLALDAVFLQHLCRSLGRKLGRVIRNSALNQLHPLENRLASYILVTATANQRQQSVFTGNLTHIADVLGTSYRHLHRTLQSLCEQGILRKAGTSYTIQQLSELERRAAGVYVLA